MKRATLISRLTVLWVSVAVNLLGCSLAQIEQRAAESRAPGVANAAVTQPEIAGPSCGAPTDEIADGCLAQAEQVLASTVRLEFHGPDGGIGHATVVGGRYLVTHNHYLTSGETLSRGGEDFVSAVSVYKVNGDVILLKAPLTCFTITVIGEEVLVLDFRKYGEMGLFDSFGVPSAELIAWDAIDVRPGNEVAQVDWNGSTAHIIWARVTAVHDEGPAPYLELDTFVGPGASGGGIYYNGYHIANNWSRNKDREVGTGKVLRQYSTAALNTRSVITLGHDVSGVAVAGNFGK